MAPGHAAATVVTFAALALGGCATEPEERFMMSGSVVSAAGTAVQAGVEAWRLATSPEEEDRLWAESATDAAGLFRIESSVRDASTWEVDCIALRLRVSAGSVPFFHALTAAEQEALCLRRTVEEIRIVTP